MKIVFAMTALLFFSLTVHAAKTAKTTDRKVASINCSDEATKLATSMFSDAIANVPNAGPADAIKLVGKFGLDAKNTDSISVYGFSGSYFTTRNEAVFRYYLTITMNSNCSARSVYAYEAQEK